MVYNPKRFGCSDRVSRGPIDREDCPGNPPDVSCVWIVRPAPRLQTASTIPPKIPTNIAIAQRGKIMNWEGRADGLMNTIELMLTIG